MPDAHFHAELARVLLAEGKSETYAEELRTTEALLVGAKEGHATGTAGATHDHGHSHQVGLEMARFELEFHKDLPVALANADHEFEHRENNIDVNMALAAILYAQGAFGQAATHVKIAQRTGSKSAELLLLNGLVTAANGNHDAGKQLVKDALRTDPYLQHPLASEGRAMLQR